MSVTKSKIFGVGMSKTGTTTLGRCFELLGMTPHAGYDPELKDQIHSGHGVERALKIAHFYRSFEDSPWYLIYPELDKAFPGSKFILTIRENSFVHARSSWNHGSRRGLRATKDPDAEYLKTKIQSYESHNAGVLEYFRSRPDDLLVVCWERGDGWAKLCNFLDVPIPDAPLPHENRAMALPLPQPVLDSRPYKAMLRLVHRVWLSPPARRLSRLRKRDARHA